MVAPAVPARYAWLQPAPGVDLVHEQPGFLARLNAVGAALKRRILIFSGYRAPGSTFTNLYGQQTTEAAGPHNLGIAADATIGGVPIGRVRGAQAAIAAQGLRSGDQPGFYKGQPDPAHVDAAGAPSAVRGGSQLAALEKLWTDAGGPAAAAPTMAAVALAESRGNASAHNNNPATGDDSYGLWQINYYGDLRASRTARFGPPQGLLHPAANARAAVAIYNGSGPAAWSTYKSGAYTAYLGGTSGTPSSIRVRPASGGVSGFLGGVAGGAEGAAQSAWDAFVGVVDGPLAIVKAALWLLKPISWLRAVEFLVGLWLIVLGLLGLAVIFASRSPTVRKAASVASMVPGPVGAIGKGVTVAGASPVRAHLRRRPGVRGARGDRTPPEATAPRPAPRPTPKRKAGSSDDVVIRS